MRQPRLRPPGPLDSRHPDRRLTSTSHRGACSSSRQAARAPAAYPRGFPLRRPRRPTRGAPLPAQLPRRTARHGHHTVALIPDLPGHPHIQHRPGRDHRAAHSAQHHGERQPGTRHRAQQSHHGLNDRQRQDEHSTHGRRTDRIRHPPPHRGLLHPQRLPRDPCPARRRRRTSTLFRVQGLSTPHRCPPSGLLPGMRRFYAGGRNHPVLRAPRNPSPSYRQTSDRQRRFLDPSRNEEFQPTAG